MLLSSQDMNERKKLLDYLKNNEILSLATYGKTLSVCTTYYGIDDHFNLYIITPPSTEHGKNIKTNNNVACIITDSHQPMFKSKYKIGVQIKGKAKEITSEKEIEKALIIWSKNQNDIVKKFMINIKNKIWKSRPFIIKPKIIKWFNEELYGEEGTKIFKF